MLQKWGMSLLLLVSLALAKDQVEITAKHFVADEAKKTTLITGDVVVVRGDDRLITDKLTVFFDDKNRPLKYEAQGNVKFAITLADGRKLKGYSNNALYDAPKNEYHLLGNAFMEEIGKSNTVKGEKIIINRVSGFANVVGDSQKPAKLIFIFEEDESKKRPAPTPTTNMNEKGADDNGS